MEVADLMLGNWKVDTDLTENFDAYAEAMKLPPELAQQIKNEKHMAEEVSRKDDTYTMIGITGDRKQTMKFKLGETFKTVDFGVEAENVYTVEGDKVVGKHTFLGMTTFTRRHIENGKQILESEGNGVTMKHVFVKY